MRYLVTVPLFEEMQYVYGVMERSGGKCDTPLFEEATHYPFSIAMSNVSGFALSAALNDFARLNF